MSDSMRPLSWQCRNCDRPKIVGGLCATCMSAAYESALTALEASDSDRETLKQRLDGVYGALADAANIVVSTDNPGESVRMLLAERDQLSARVKTLEAELAKEQRDG
jgi:hypothetical protein